MGGCQRRALNEFSKLEKNHHEYDFPHLEQSIRPSMTVQTVELRVLPHRWHAVSSSIRTEAAVFSARLALRVSRRLFSMLLCISWRRL